MSSFVATILTELLFPKTCVGCGRWGTWWCPDCHTHVEWLDAPLHPRLHESYLDAVWAAARHQPPIQQLVTQLKYHSIKELSVVVARLLYLALPQPTANCVTAVPLHPRRQRHRGFNQAELIARHLADYWQLPYHNLLLRSRYTAPQAQQTSRSQRLQHLDHAFVLAPHLQQPHLPSSIIVVDDVITTGTTLNQCAAVLKHHGVSFVTAVGLSHGS